MSTREVVGREKEARQTGAERLFRSWKAGKDTARAVPITKARLGSQAGSSGERKLREWGRGRERCARVWVHVWLPGWASGATISG